MTKLLKAGRLSKPPLALKVSKHRIEGWQRGDSPTAKESFRDKSALLSQDLVLYQGVSDPTPAPTALDSPQRAYLVTKMGLCDRLQRSASLCSVCSST